MTTSRARRTGAITGAAHLILAGSAGVAALLTASGAHAQATPPQPVAPTREEVRRGDLDERLRTQGQALSVDEGVERAPCPLANPQFADLKFTLERAEFGGLDGIDAATLDPAWRDLAGKELPVAAVCEIRDRAATILRRAGYLAAVQVPAQKIDAGTVKFDVLLAHMADVQVRGEAGASEAVLRRYIDKIRQQGPFNVNAAERYLLLARDVPGLDVRLSLQPVPQGSGGQPGDVVGVINVTRTPVFADLNIQNYGSNAVGRFGGLARVRVNGLTGLGDETVLSAFSTADFKEQLVGSAQHSFTVGGEGLRLGASITYARTKPDIGFRLKSDTVVANGYATYPFIRSQAGNLFGTAGLEYVDQTIDTQGIRTNKDTLAVAYARTDFNLVDPGSLVGRGGYSAIEPKWAMAGSFELRQGLDILGASQGCGPALINCRPPVTVIPTRADGDPTAFVVRGEARIDWRPIPLLTLSLKPRFQWSPDALFSYEEISGGNYTAGRGYDPGIVIGDSGYGLQSEIAYGSLIPKRPDAIAVQPFAFFDMMGVWNKGVPGDPDRIYSVGGGARATIGRHATLDAVVAVPLNRPFASTPRDVRGLVSLTVQLAPWK